MFFKHCKELNLERTLKFFRIASKLYNPLESEQLPEHELSDDDELDFFAGV